MAGEYNFEVKQGSSFELTITYKPGGTPADLSTYEAKMQLREFYDKPPLLTLTSENGMLDLTSGTTGQIKIKLEKADTAKLTKPRMMYDLDIYIPGSEQTSLITVIEGVVTLNKEITKNV
jgi:hypothetical protein